MMIVMKIEELVKVKSSASLRPDMRYACIPVCIFVKSQWHPRSGMSDKYLLFIADFAGSTFSERHCSDVSTFSERHCSDVST
jgi:hypothetical protein